jgi:hypothetical protein
MKKFYGSIVLVAVGLISAVVHADPVESARVLQTAVLTEAMKDCAKPDVGLRPLHLQSGAKYLVTDQGLVLLSSPPRESIPALEHLNTGN